MKDTLYKFVLVAGLFVVVVCIINNINHNFEMNDFKVYYNAAKAFTHHQQLYGKIFALDSGFYKYSPFTALAFVPLSWLPYHTACMVYFFIIGIGIALTGLLIFKMLNTYVFNGTVKSPNTIVLLSALCVISHFVRELTMGNINVIMLLLVGLCPYFIMKQKNGAAAVVLALAIITKPFFILLFIPLFIYKYYKVITHTLLTLVVLVLLPLVVAGVGNNIVLHREWINAVFLHASGFDSPDMLNSIIQNWLYDDMPRIAQYALLLNFLGVFYFFWRDKYNNLQADSKANTAAFIMQWFMLVAVMPSLLATDTEHFLMTWPLIMFLLIYLFQNKNWVFTALFIVTIVMYDGNSSDLIGRKLSQIMHDAGILGVSNLLITAMVGYIFFKQWLHEKKPVKQLM